MRIFLANIGFRRATHPLVTPPLGIMYLAGYLRSRFEADFLLLNQKVENTSNEKLVKQAQTFGAGIIGLSVLTPYAHYLPEITKGLRMALPDSLIVLGGPHVSAYGSASLEGNFADAAVPHEGEAALEKLVQAYLNGGDMSGVAGIHWRDADNNIVTNPGQVPYIKDLDTLPFPAYDLIDLPAYWKLQSMPPLRRRRYVSLFSSRGCPYRCIYCHRIFGNRFRYHSAERIVEEIEYYKKVYEIDEIEFLDDVFNFNNKRLNDFTELIQRKGLRVKIAFPNGVRSDILNENSIDALVDSGLYFCSFALESGSSRIQKYTGKNLDIPAFLRNVDYAVSRGVFSNGFVMFGFPTETEEDMKKTIEVACSSRLHTASFFTLTPFPGTDVYDIIKKTAPGKMRNLIYDDMEYSLAKVNVSDVADETLYKYQRKANWKFFMDPLRIGRILRDYPQPHMLPLYIPEFLLRATKGLLNRR